MVSNEDDWYPAVEEHPTPHLKFINGKLHQLWHVRNGRVESEVWRIVPSEVTEDVPPKPTVEQRLKKVEDYIERLESWAAEQNRKSE